MYVFYIIIFFIAVLFFIRFLKFKKVNDSYTNQRYNWYILLGKKILENIILIAIGSDIFYFIFSFVLGNKLNVIELVIDVILSSILIYIYLNLEKKYKYSKNFSYIEKDSCEIKDFGKIINNIFIFLIVAKRVGDINNFTISFIFNIMVTLLILIELYYFIKFLSSNKNYTCWNAKEEDFINNIKFTNKIEVGKVVNYLVFLLIYILLIYANLPFFYLIHILLFIVLLIIINKKVKRIINEKEKLYRNIAIVGRKPGVIYAFEFGRDIEFTKNLTIISLFYICSIVVFYLLGYSAFLFFAIQSIIFIIYALFRSKKELIKLVYSLDSNYINKDIYTIKKNVDISEIYKLKLNKKELFYRLIYIDNNKNVYKSNIVLYDPELYISNMTIYINSKDIDDYIVILEELY